MLFNSGWNYSFSWSLDDVDYSIVILNQMDEESSQLIIEVKIQRWQFKSCQLSLACWPTLSVGFDRPFTHKHIKRVIFWWRTRSFLLRCGRAREGRLVRADSCVSVCQPFLVLPPLFDSNLVELFNTHKESAMRTTFLNAHSLFYLSIFYGVVDVR